MIHISKNKAFNLPIILGGKKWNERNYILYRKFKIFELNFIILNIPLYEFIKLREQPYKNMNLLIDCGEKVLPALK